MALLGALLSLSAHLDACSREVHDVFDVLALAANHSPHRLLRDVEVHHLQLLLRGSLVGTPVVRGSPVVASGSTLKHTHVESSKSNKEHHHTLRHK